MDSINSRIAEELGVRPQQVEAAVALLDEGSTVPFIARYRKEVTGSLDDIQLRHLEERLRYLRELDERRVSILASIQEQGKLTPQLERDIKLADTKTRLEDLNLPYKQKRRTKGQIALEAGLGEYPSAFARLERLGARGNLPPALEFDPLFDGLRRQPQWPAIAALLAPRSP